MKLSGSEIKELREALIDAFPSTASLKRLIIESGLGITIDGTFVSDSLYDIVFELIDWAESHNKLDTLINAIYDENPGNAKLKTFFEKILTINESNTSTHSDEAKTFTFEVVTVDRTGAIIKRETRSAQYFTENLGSNVTLDTK